MIANIMYSSGEAYKGPQLVHQLITRGLVERGRVVHELYLTGDVPGKRTPDGTLMLTSARAARQKGIWRCSPPLVVRRKLLSWLRARDIQLAICDGLGVARLLMPILEADKALKLVVVIHGKIKLKPQDMVWIDRYPERIKIVAVSNWVARKLTEQKPLLINLITSIQNTLDPSFSGQLLSRKNARSALGLPDEKFLYVISSRLVEGKDISTGIRAFKKCDRKDSYLVIIGDGPERENLRILADELELKDSVIWLGWRESAGRYLRAFDLYLSSAISEGYSMSVLEAYAAGLPIVCSKIPSHEEMLGERGNYFPVDDIDACAVALSSPLRPAEPCNLNERYQVFVDQYLHVIDTLIHRTI